MKKRKKIVIAGTFDILHPGHVYFLKEARKHGDSLVVVIARDETVKNLKGENSYGKWTIKWDQSC